MEIRKSLYRKYRPKNFDELMGQKEIKEILISQILANSFGHALLFSGQRGTGKTSLAKIFSKVINCEKLNNYNPCDKCLSCTEFNNNSHIDIYEIDAASNNGVEEIRNIKSNISLLTNFAKYKVYIIDEVHMLSNSAFNALLKTLEEPPSHVIFILATTEFFKIPQTIISRCQIFNFKKINKEDLENRINDICNKEGFKISPEALNEIFYLSDGSLRDALNYLEQSMISSTKEITIKEIKKIFYVATHNEKIQILKNILENNATSIVEYFENSKKMGIDFQIMLLGLLDILKEIIEVKLTGDKKYLNNLNEIDFTYFEDKNINKLFDISASLTNSYIKSKNINISFQSILIDILKIVDNKTLISVKNKVENKKEENIIQEFGFSNNKNNNEITLEKDIVLAEKNEENKKLERTKNLLDKKNDNTYNDGGLNEKNIEEENIKLKNDEEIKKDLLIKNEQKRNNENKITYISKNKEIYFDENLNNKYKNINWNKDILKKLYKEILINEVDDSKWIKFKNDIVLELLVDANKELRISYSNKIKEFFNKNHFEDLMFLKTFIMFYNAKIVSASENSIIFSCSNELDANWINYRIINNEKMREDVYNFFNKKLKIICIDKIRLSNIKEEYKNNKKIENNKIEVEDFYINLFTQEEFEDNSIINEIKKLLSIQNIKVVD